VDDASGASDDRRTVEHMFGSRPTRDATGAPGTELAPAEAERLDRIVALPPGPLAMGLLDRVAVPDLDADARVTLLQAWERQSRWVSSRQAASVVAVAGARPADRDDFVREHVRIATRECGGSARSEVDTARALAGPLSAAMPLLEQGQVSWQHVRVLAQETEDVDPHTRRDVIEQVVTDVEAAASRGISWTPAELRTRVRRAVIAADPVAAELRAEKATEQRHVSRRTDRDAQASLFVNGPAMGVQTIWTAMDLRASATSANDERTLDQRRFDALVDICRLSSTDAALVAAASCDRSVESSPESSASGSAQRRSRRLQRRERTGLEPAVFVFADAATWAGLADEPVELDGYGPIPAGVARECFTDATWRAVVTDAVTGAAVSVSDTTYRPSARTRRLLYVKDRRCGFPGCSAAVWFCDADHSVPHELGGCTDTENCGLLCRRHHRLKTFTAWRWRRLPDGTLEWTDPSGRTWRRGASPVLRLPEVRPRDRDDGPGPVAAARESARAPRDGPGGSKPDPSGPQPRRDEIPPF
jgi:hypothetical protein